MLRNDVERVAQYGAPQAGPLKPPNNGERDAVLASPYIIFQEGPRPHHGAPQADAPTIASAPNPPRSSLLSSLIHPPTLHGAQATPNAAVGGAAPQQGNGMFWEDSVEWAQCILAAQKIDEKNVFDETCKNRILDFISALQKR